MRIGSLHDDVGDHGIVPALAAMSFATGALDSFSIATYLCFLANQTGNSILLYVGAFGLIEHIRFINVCVSLGTFILSCMIAGQLGNHFGRRRRWWLLLSHSFQTFIIVLSCILIGTNAISNTAPTRFTSVVLLSAASGIQVAMARSMSVPEVPTAMLTTPYGDLLVDPELFKLGRSKSRDRRLFHIACMWSGGAIGAAMYRCSTELAPVYLAIAVKSLVTVVLLFLPAQKKEAKDKESARMVVRRCSGSSSSPADIQSQGSSA